MDVFISWSGDRSKAVAELLKEWLKCVIQASEPWVSSKDIDRGSMWFSEVSEQLNNSSIGIICLSRDNLNKPWLLFEAGALAKGLPDNRVCTFLIDLKNTDIDQPLSQFNHTVPNKEGVFSLVQTINKHVEKGTLEDSVLKKVFETYWPQFIDEYETILKKYPLVNTDEPIRSEESMLAEILGTIRNIDRKSRATPITFDNKNQQNLFTSNLLKSSSLKDLTSNLRYFERELEGALEENDRNKAMGLHEEINRIKKKIVMLKNN